MHFLRRRLRPLTWVALVAMLGLGLLPAVSHALASAGGRGGAEVCTAGGLTRVAAAGAPTGSDSQPATTALVHCPFCAPGAPAAGPLPAPRQAWLAQGAALAALPDARVPPTLPASWAAAQPRAPPGSR